MKNKYEFNDVCTVACFIITIVVIILAFTFSDKTRSPQTGLTWIESNGIEILVK